MKIRLAGLNDLFSAAVAASAFAVSPQVPGGEDREGVDASAFHPKTVKVAVGKGGFAP